MLLSQFLPELFHHDKDSIGIVQIFSGRVSLVKNGQEEKIDKTKEFSVDTQIATDFNSEAGLEFRNGSEVLLESETTVFVGAEDKIKDSIQLTIQRGQIRVVKEGPSQALWITQNGKTQKAADYRPQMEEMIVDLNSGENLPALIEEKTASPESAQKAEAPPALDEKTVGSKLDNAGIRTVLGRNRNLFFRCYTQFLQKSNPSNLRVELSFTIQNTGETTDAKVSFASVEDESFNRCLTEALGRITFPPFTGSPISTLFPLRFE